MRIAVSAGSASPALAMTSTTFVPGASPTVAWNAPPDTAARRPSTVTVADAGRTVPRSSIRASRTTASSRGDVICRRTGAGAGPSPPQPPASAHTAAAASGSRRANGMALPAGAQALTRSTRQRRGPLGASTSTTSPGAAPISACAIGDSAERRPVLRSASVGPTSVNVWPRPVFSSTTCTVEPKWTLSASMGAATTCARRRRSARRWIFVSRCAWSSLAAWYSAFSLRSPCSRAAEMRRAMAWRPWPSRSASSCFRASRPSAVIASPALIEPRVAAPPRPGGSGRGGGGVERMLGADVVERRALGGRAARGVGGGDELRRVEPHAVVGAGEAADRLLHERAAEVVDAPAQRLGRGVEPHLHPAGLHVADRTPEGEPEHRGVLEVLLAGDLLDAVGAAEQRVERDERQRHELGDPARPLLERPHDAHVLGELPRLLDVPEHDRRRRAQPGAMARLDDLHPPGDRKLVRRDPLAHAVVEHLGGGARRRVEPGLAQAGGSGGRREGGAGGRGGGGDVANWGRDLHRAVGVDVEVRRRVLDEPQPEQVVLERPIRVDARLHADLGRAVVDRLVDATHELAAVVLVGVGRALALTEAAERAADDADVRDVDVAVDDERDGLACELGTEVVRGGAHLLDRLGPGLGEHRRQLVGLEPPAGARLGDRAGDEVGP